MAKNLKTVQGLETAIAIKIDKRLKEGWIPSPSNLLLVPDLKIAPLEAGAKEITWGFRLIHHFSYLMDNLISDGIPDELPSVNLLWWSCWVELSWRRSLAEQVWYQVCFPSAAHFPSRFWFVGLHISGFHLCWLLRSLAPFLSGPFDTKFIPWLWSAILIISSLLGGQSDKCQVCM